ncbi:MAG: rhamnulokinase [Thaumarchaeota archaeon]|nr:rhamnulokinase [Nitrososphaerota archaeon]
MNDYWRARGKSKEDAVKGSAKRFLGIDLGASSGRIFLGTLENGRLSISKIYGFPNQGVQIFNGLYWDTPRLFEEVKKGLRVAVENHGSSFNGIGVDTWGVSFALLDNQNDLVGLPRHYRDRRADGMLEKLVKKVPADELFRRTGIQPLQINTSTQLFTMVETRSPQLQVTEKLLMMPDYFNFLLTGVTCSEYTVATTSQLYDPFRRDWASDLVKRLGLNVGWFQKIIEPGAALGRIHETVEEQTGLDLETPVIAIASHDTAAAVAAVPVEEDIGGWAYISSGTWSLMGVELERPLISEEALRYGLSNEGGVFGTVRLLKNIIGLWLVQKALEQWKLERDAEITYDDIERQAEQAEPFAHFIVPDSSVFLNPENMVDAIQKYCRASEQEVPRDIGSVSRSIFEGLAFRYRQTLEQLQDVSEKPIESIYVVGGGSKNSLLYQFTSNATGLPVNAGPSEATVAGNILMQAAAAGEIDSLKALRETVKKSFNIKSFRPMMSSEWEEAYKRYLRHYEQQRTG